MGLPSTGFGTSPMTVFSGQKENAGHFAHPTASATGQSVMTAPCSTVVKGRAYADVAALTVPDARRRLAMRHQFESGEQANWRLAAICCRSRATGFGKPSCAATHELSSRLSTRQTMSTRVGLQTDELCR